MRKLTTVVLMALQVFAIAEHCYFNFESETDLLNFDKKCDGDKGSWIITNTSVYSTIPPEEYHIGEKVLTVEPYMFSCIIQKEAVLVGDQPNVTVYLALMGPVHGFSIFNVMFNCDSTSVYWDVLSGIQVTNEGKWYKIVQTLDVPAGMCKVRMECYINYHEIAIDRIEIEGVDTNSCDLTSNATSAATEPSLPISHSTASEADTTITTSSEPITLTTDPTDATEETTIPPTEATTIPPTEGTEETTIQPTEATEETTIPPTEATEETTIPPTEATEETTIPPTEATTIQPTEATEETTIPPTEATEETTIQPTEATTIPPTEATEETTISPTEGTEETTIPPTEGTEETTIPPMEETTKSATEKTTTPPTDETTKLPSASTTITSSSPQITQTTSSSTNNPTVQPNSNYCFDFESDEEFQNFDLQCDGIKGIWNMTASSTFTPAQPEEYAIGKMVLTAVPQQSACMRSLNKLTLMEDNPTVSVYFVWRGSINGWTGLSIKFDCDAALAGWSVLDGLQVTAKGKWYKLSQTMHIPAGRCYVTVELYRSEVQEIGIDRIEIDGLDSDACLPTTL